MEPTKELVDDIYRSRVLHARSIPPGEKLMDGFRLFEEVCERMKAGIRMTHPELDEVAVSEMLRNQIARLRQVEEHGIYHPLTSVDCEV